MKINSQSLCSFGRTILLFPSLKYYYVAIFIFITGVCISFTFFQFYRKLDTDQLKAEYTQLANSQILIVQEVLNDTFKQFKYTKLFFEVMTPPHINKNNFHAIAQNAIHLDPNILAIAWIEAQKPNVMDPDLGFDFVPFHFDDPRHSQFVYLNYLELDKPNLPLFFSLSDYPAFKRAHDKVNQTLSLTVSELIHYYQDGSKLGFFIFEPVLNHIDNNANSKTVEGMLIGFSDFKTILEQVQNIHPGISLSIYEEDHNKEKLLMGNGESAAPFVFDGGVFNNNDHHDWTIQHSIEVGDRLWRIVVTPNKSLLEYHPKKHLEIPILGFIGSLLIASYFLFLINRRLVIEKEVNLRTKELEQMNRLLQEEVHARQMIEMDIIQNQRYLQKSHEAVKYLSKLTISDLKVGLKEVILRTAEVMEVDRVGIWLYETVEDHLFLNCIGLYNYSTNSFTDHLEFASNYFPRYFETLKLHHDLIIPSKEHVEVNQELASYLTTSHIISKLDIPVIFEGKLLGVLCCEETRHIRPWELEDRHFGHTMADIVATMLEQDARRKVENALRISEERIRFITQKGADAIISFSDTGLIVSWNYGAEHMFGYTESEVIGKPLTLIIPDQELHKNKVSNKPIELVSRHKEGRFLPIELTHSRWKSGDETFDMIIVRDVTERKEYEKKLIKAIREANAANEAKSEFLTVISHELRTPLNAIIGYDQCLIMGMDGPVNEQQIISLKKIEKSSFHLLHLINDILDLAKIEASKMELEITPQNIVDTLVSCVEEIQALARQKDLKVNVSCDKPYILMEYDKTRIRQVLLNLLGNAVKFTEKGSITITLINFPNNIEIHIADTGIGLSPDEIIKLFMAFSQADNSITRRYGGTGLGLAISKKIIDMHGGNIDVHSEKGKGSDFIVNLPKIQ